MLADPLPDLDLSLAQGVDPQARWARAHQPGPQGIQQPAGGTAQQAGLFGPEAVAAESSGKAGAFEVVQVA